MDEMVWEWITCENNLRTWDWYGLIHTKLRLIITLILSHHCLQIALPGIE